MGERLVREGRVPDRIWCSSAARAHQTAEIVAESCGYAGKIRIEPRIYLAESGIYLDLLSALSEQRERVLVIGHNPGISNLLFALTGQSESMIPAAIAPIELEAERWREVHWARPGRALGVWSPTPD